MKNLFNRIKYWIWSKIEPIFTKFKNWFWFKFIIKGNEFDRSLDLDIDKYAACKNEKERDKYMKDLVKRRNLAHELDIKHI